MRSLMTIHGTIFISVLTAFVALSLSESVVYAQNSLGIGVSEQAIKPEGPFASILFWIQEQQKSFYRSLTSALASIRAGEGGFLILVGLSFAYGVLHAAGPGHGKAVISSYMVANEVQLRRGVVLSFASAALQAIVAIVMIGLLIFVLRGLGFKQSEFTKSLEVASYLGVTLLGAWLLYRKIFPSGYSHGHSHHKLVAHANPPHTPALAHAHSHANAQTHHVHHDHNHSHDHHHGHGHGHHHHHHDHDHDHAEGEVCPSCGHAHMPDPKMLEGDFGIREAWSAVFAVGLRPCTGALIVLTFSFLNGLYFAGIVSTFAMAIGTAITVATIASLAVGAKNLALHLSGATEASAGFYRWVEILGATFILLIGLTLLSASLA